MSSTLRSHSRNRSSSTASSHLHYRKSSVTTIANPTSSEVVREKQLEWMFNRRKQKLAQTSKQNIKLYMRIQRQKSVLAPTFNQASNNTIKQTRPKSSRMYLERGDKENTYVDNELKRRNDEIRKLLSEQYVKRRRENREDKENTINISQKQINEQKYENKCLNVENEPNLYLLGSKHEQSIVKDKLKVWRNSQSKPNQIEQHIKMSTLKIRPNKNFAVKRRESDFNQAGAKYKMMILS